MMRSRLLERSFNPCSLSSRFSGLGAFRGEEVALGESGDLSGTGDFSVGLKLGLKRLT